MRKTDLYICAVALVTTLGTMAVVAKAIAPADEALLRVAECTTAKWQEYEDRTGEMPSVTLEQSWYLECGEQSNERK